MPRFRRFGPTAPIVTACDVACDAIGGCDERAPSGTGIGSEPEGADGGPETRMTPEVVDGSAGIPGAPGAPGNEPGRGCGVANAACGPGAANGGGVKSGGGRGPVSCAPADIGC